MMRYYVTLRFRVDVTRVASESGGTWVLPSPLPVTQLLATSGLETAMTWDPKTRVATSTDSFDPLTEDRIYANVLLRLTNIQRGLFHSTPDDTGTPLVYWYDWLQKAPAVSESIRDFERGFSTVGVSSLEVLIPNHYKDFLMPGRAAPWQGDTSTEVLIYREDELFFRGLLGRSNYRNGKWFVQVQPDTRWQDKDVTFGDADHECYFRAGHNSALYNGANIAPDFIDKPIPTLMGREGSWVLGGFTGFSRENGAQTSFPIIPIAGRPKMKEILGGLTPVPIGNGEFLVCKIMASALPSAIGTFTQAHDRLFRQWTIAGHGANSRVLPGALAWCWVNSDFPAFFGGQNLSGGASPSVGVYAENPGDTFNRVFYAGTVIPIIFPDGTYPAPTGTPTITYTASSTAGGNFIIKSSGWSSAGVGVTSGGVPGARACVTGLSTAIPSHAAILQRIVSGAGKTPVSSTFTAVDTALARRYHRSWDNTDRLPKVRDIVAETMRNTLGYLETDRVSGAVSYRLIEPPTLPLASTRIHEARHVSLKSVEYETRDTFPRTRVRFKELSRESTQELNLAGVVDDSVSAVEAGQIKDIDNVLDQITGAVYQRVADFWSSPKTRVQYTLHDESRTAVIGQYVHLKTNEYDGVLLVTDIRYTEIEREITGLQLEWLDA